MEKHAWVLHALALRWHENIAAVLTSDWVIADLPVSLGSRLLDEQIAQEQQWRAELPGGLQQLISAPGASVQAAEEQVCELTATGSAPCIPAASYPNP